MPGWGAGGICPRGKGKSRKVPDGRQDQDGASQCVSWALFLPGRSLDSCVQSTLVGSVPARGRGMRGKTLPILGKQRAEPCTPRTRLPDVCSSETGPLRSSLNKVSSGLISWRRAVYLPRWEIVKALDVRTLKNLVFPKVTRLQTTFFFFPTKHILKSHRTSFPRNRL